MVSIRPCGGEAVSRVYFRLPDGCLRYVEAPGQQDAWRKTVQMYDDTHGTELSAYLTFMDIDGHDYSTWPSIREISAEDYRQYTDKDLLWNDIIVKQVEEAYRKLERATQGILKIRCMDTAEGLSEDGFDTIVDTMDDTYKVFEMLKRAQYLADMGGQ